MVSMEAPRVGSSEWKALMMPQTVPNNPMYGLVEPIVASTGRCISRCSASRASTTRMLRTAVWLIVSGDNCLFPGQLHVFPETGAKHFPERRARLPLSHLVVELHQLDALPELVLELDCFLMLPAQDL